MVTILDPGVCPSAIPSLKRRLRPGRPGPRICLAAWLFCASLSLVATEADRPPQATVVGLIGQVEFRPAATETWYAATTNQVLYAGDYLRTGARSRAILQLRDRSVLPLRESSTIQLLAQPESVVVELLRGILSFFHRDEPGRIEVRSGGINASVRGTEFAFEAHDDGTIQLTLFDGEVVLADAAGNELALQSGEVATAGPGQPPRKVAPLRAGDWASVQWLLYYPAILDPAEIAFRASTNSALTESWLQFNRGNLPAALAAYPTNRPPATPEEQVFAAALLLAVGSVEEAEELLRSANVPPALGPVVRAHQALIETVRRGPSTALDPGTSPTALLAASYARQAEAQLIAARDLAREATERSPGFGFAWVRLAELEFSLGNHQRAQEALERGEALVPEHAAAEVLRGFLLASRHHARDAGSAFEHALRLDPALGNAWLGRGLVRLRRGDLAGGRADLMVAAATEPQRSVLRSYLAKALADSRLFRTRAQEEKARHELELARRLDPGDPTPWLYAALLDQQENRINDSVTDLERSIELNDNRALYRSQFGLDQDRAVRGANLAAVFQDAGLDAVAVRQATRAVEDDYANFSSHQFLADSYNALRDPDQVDLRYESAWFSEYLVANLLAPVGAGRLSTTVAPNEYSRLFERDGPGLAGRTDYWSNGDWQQSAAQFGTFGGFEYSVDVSYRSDNGQRVNDDAEQLSVSAQAKQQLGLNDSVFLQAIYYDAEFGDVAHYYDPADANPDLRAADRQEPQLLAGWHHAWTPGSDTLVLLSRLNDNYFVSDPHLPQSVVFRNPDGSVFNSATAPTPLEYASEFSAWSLEGQHVWQQDPHTVVAGLRYQTGTFDTRAILGPSRALGIPIPGLDQVTEADLGRFSAYAYEHWQLLDWLRLSAGLSYDWLRQPVNYRVPPLAGGETESDQVSPKGGLTVTPWKDGVWRAAYTRSLGGVSFDQSFRLEPTQIAGFNQTYRTLIPESIAGSVAGQDFETWGLSFEQRFPTRTYLTLALERLGSDADRSIGTREVSLGGAPTVGSSRQVLDFEERSLFATVNQLVGRDFSVGIGYRLSRATLASLLVDVPGSAAEVESQLQQVDLEARFNHPSGWFAVAEAIWTHQRNDGYGGARPGDDFWHLNLLTGWRFYQRNFEIATGILNLTDEDYRLNPLNNYREPYRDRTWTMSLRFDF